MQPKSQLINEASDPENYFYRQHGKWLFDILLVVLILPILIPLLIIVSLCIVLDSGFPIVFTQKRVGKCGKVFIIYKFRSMKPDAQALQCEYRHLNEADGPVFKIRDDPRYTSLGK